MGRGGGGGGCGGGGGGGGGGGAAEAAKWSHLSKAEKGKKVFDLCNQSNLFREQLDEVRSLLKAGAGPDDYKVSQSVIGRREREGRKDEAKQQQQQPRWLDRLPGVLSRPNQRNEEAKMERFDLVKRNKSPE